MKLERGKEAERQSELTRCHLLQGKKRCSIHEGTNCPAEKDHRHRNRCHSELIVMGFTLLTVVVVIIFHYNVIWSATTSADHIPFPPVTTRFTQGINHSSLPSSPFQEEGNETLVTTEMTAAAEHTKPLLSFPESHHPPALNGTVNVNISSESWIEQKITSLDPKIYTETLILIDKVIHWVNSSLTLSIITPLILGASAGLLLVLFLIYLRNILYCIFYCLSCGCITCYCRRRRRRKNFELGLNGKFFDGKRLDELENHYLLVPKIEEEAVDAEEDSDADVELYNKQKVNV